jgi:hypothetical protein
MAAAQYQLKKKSAAVAVILKDHLVQLKMANQGEICHKELTVTQAARR